MDGIQAALVSALLAAAGGWFVARRQRWVFAISTGVAVFAICVAINGPVVGHGSPTARAPTPQALVQFSGLDWPKAQTRMKRYDQSGGFWDRLYPSGEGVDVYCGQTFVNRKTADGRHVEIEHAYPKHTIKTQLAGDQKKWALADLHNLWPAVKNINASRQQVPFREITPDQHPDQFKWCPDYERDYDTDAVEPHDEVQGDLARSIVYMHFVYGLSVEKSGDPEALATWMKKDTVSPGECQRDERIIRIQGTGNPLISTACPVGVVLLGE